MLVWEIEKIVQACSRKLDHRTFNEHFEILALLTNEQIKVSSLAEEDEKYFKAYLQIKRAQYEVCREKRRISSHMYIEKIQKRMEIFK